MTPEVASRIIKRLAKEQGFFACGISKADFLEEEATGLERWLKAGFHGDMSWMENHFDARLDPRKLMPGAKSVVSVLLNYYPAQEQNVGVPKISKYAYGRDYHKVIRGKLKRMLEGIRAEVGEVEGRGFVDSAPVMDRAWARRSGLGWIGKHSLLLSKKEGSFFFIAEKLAIEKMTVTDRTFSAFLGSGFDYQITKRFKINMNYKANLSTNPEFPILSFFLIGSKVNL